MSLGPPTRRPERPRRPKHEQKRPLRPPPHWFTVGSFRSFAKRLMHPPPPMKEERYYLFVVPRYDVSLEDVVANKHLSPLSLQDFEDYLRYVEGTPQNLYFRQWLQRYRTLHHSWVASVLPAANVPSTSTGGYRSRDLWERLNPCQDRHLKDEFISAKARFFDEHAPMRLDISDEMRRSVLVISNLPPQGTHELTHNLPSFPNQPTPSHFDTVLAHVNIQLRAALSRFLRIAFCNGGLLHACVGHVCGIVLMLTPGMTLWYLGVTGGGRGLIAGSLPLIWWGLTMMCMTAAGHCFAIWATGDARQLYPHELIRPLPPDVTPPPVYSLARPPQPDEVPPPPYTSRKLSTGSGLLPFSTRAERRRSSVGMLGMFGRRSEEGTPIELEDWTGRRKSAAVLGVRKGERGGRETGEDVAVEMGSRRTMERTAEMELKLPPPRKTKDLPKQALVIDALPSVHRPTPLLGRVPELQPDWEDEIDIGEHKFTEEEDFGIVVSEAYNEDEEAQYPYTQYSASMEGSSGGAHTADDSAPASSTLEPLAPLVQAPEYKRQKIPDLVSFSSPSPTPLPTPKPNHTLDWAMSQAGPGTRRGSKSDINQPGELMSPRWRSMLGPMTLVHDPMVRRAHWAVTMRCAIVAFVVTMGMALGFVR